VSLAKFKVNSVNIKLGGVKNDQDLNNRLIHSI